MNFIPDRIKLLFRLIIIQIGFLFLYRLAFCIAFFRTAEDFSTVDLLKAFYIGTKFDLRLTMIILLIPFLLSAIPVIGTLKNRGKFRHFWLWLLTIINTIVFMFYLGDFGNYAYLQVRISSALTKFLSTPIISATMVWESYPVIWLAILSIVVIGLIHLLNKKIVFDSKLNSISNNKLPAKIFIPIWVIFFFSFVGGIYGKLGWYPLRWSEAFFSTNNFISSLGVNPVLYYIDTLKFKDVRLADPEKTKEYYDTISSYLMLPTPDKETLNYTRIEKPTPKIKGTPNVVVIVLESMVAFKSKLFGSTLDASPYLDEIAQDSLFFTKFYVPSQATARSMFALVTGLPDLSQTKTGSRNPFIINQHTVINQFKDYQKMYFLGGSANWGNIRGIFSNNIDNIEIFEDGSYTSPRMDVWGISDYHLFIEANEVLKQKNKPFFAVIQSSGFHRPYTIPEERGDFKIKEIENKNLIYQNGFVSQEEFNSLRWQDYGLGNFIKLAKKEKYFDNTIFVIYGDHGLPVLNAQHVPEGERIHNLENFHVPLLIYGPKFFKPKKIDSFASQLDILPTLAGLMGVPYTNTTLGRDIFDEKYGDDRDLFVYYWYTSPPTFGILNKKFFYTDNLQDISNLYLYRSKEPNANRKDEYPEIYKKMKELARGMYYTGRYMMENNRKKESSSLHE